MSIFISNPRGKEPLIKAFEEAGGEIEYRLSGALPLSDKVKLIIPTVDEELEFFALSKDWFQERGIRVMVSSINAIRETRDKAEFARFCRRHNFLIPETTQGPVIAKPRFGKSSRGILKIDKSYILQEDLSEFPEVSIDYFADWDGHMVSCIPRFRKHIINGASTAMELVHHVDLTEVNRMGEELGLIGHAVIQGFYANGTFIFTEVNCRFGGGSHLTFPIFNGPKWLLEHM